jgi:hypothetical protein
MADAIDFRAWQRSKGRTMAKLNQINAVEKGMKTRVYEAVTEAHKQLQKDDLFNGITRKYRPKDDDQTKPTGEVLPDESKAVTLRVANVIKETGDKLVELLDVSAVRDWANCSARADVEVNGKVLLQQVPVTYLLFLEKQLNDMHTFVKKLPTLHAGESWSFDEAQDLYATKVTESTRTKKITRPLIMAEATREHPAQVKEVTEDVLVGYWATTKYSAAMPASQVNAMLTRVEELQRAVKFAREKANETVCEKIEVGRSVIDFVFAGRF